MGSNIPGPSNSEKALRRANAPKQPGDLASGKDRDSVFYLPKDAMWHVTRYSDVRRVFSDPRTYSSASLFQMPDVPREYASDLPDGYPLQGAPVITDPPRHVQFRRLLQSAFTPQLVAERESDIRSIAESLVDQFIHEREVNLVDVYSSQVPPWVVTQLLGVPPEDREDFRLWSLRAHDVAYGLPDLPDDQLENELLDVSREMVEFDKYIRSQIEQRRQEPRDDLMSYLVHATTDEGDPSLTDKELTGTIASMVAAGSDTTSTLIAHTVYLLLSNDGAWDRVKSNEELIPQAIEESLRLHPPARAMRRTTTKATELRGVRIPEGATLYLDLVSANRDPDVFDHPEKFDLGRDNASRHLGLGHGAHFCLGAPLARLEAKVAMETLVARIPEMRLAPGQGLDDSEYVTNAFVPSLRRMRVEWTRY